MKVYQENWINDEDNEGRNKKKITFSLLISTRV